MPTKTTTQATNTTDPKPLPHKISEKFTYPTPKGNITLPYIENLEMGLIEDGAGKPFAQFLADLLQQLTKGQEEARRSLTISQFNTMIEAWGQQSAISLGELAA